MLWTLATLLVIFGLRGSLVSASVSSQELCFTKLGKSSVKPVPSNTYTFTATLTATQKVTSTPVKTITPAPVTSTSTTTSTVPATTTTVTTTLSSYTSVISTETITSTETDTVTLTTTETTTSTVSTPAGFTPISQEPGYVPKIKGREPRRVEARASPQSAIRSVNKAAKSVECSPKLYPTAVVCAKLVETITTTTLTKTASKTSTTTLPPATQTTTSTIKTTTTVTSTLPGVTATSTSTTTITVSSTTTVTTTTTTTATVTQTLSVPGATVYAACDASNIVSSANGGFEINVLAVTQPLIFSDSSAASAYDCCVQCQTTPNCVGSGYFAGSCTLDVGTTCQPGNLASGASFGTDSTPGSGGFAVSNGPCGAVANGGRG